MADSSQSAGGSVLPDGIPSGMPASTIEKNRSFVANCSAVGGSSLAGGVRLPPITVAKCWHTCGSVHWPTLR